MRLFAGNSQTISASDRTKTGKANQPQIDEIAGPACPSAFFDERAKAMPL